jgi:monoamine oxidase
LELALQGGEKLHPEFRRFVPAATGLSIAWQRVSYIGGGWAEWKQDDPQQIAAYRRLLRTDRRFVVSGDQVSYLPGWQEGAVLSAYHVVGLITGRAKLAAPAAAEPTTAPNSAAVTGAG